MNELSKTGGAGITEKHFRQMRNRMCKKYTAIRRRSRDEATKWVEAVSCKTLYVTTRISDRGRN